MTGRARLLVALAALLVLAAAVSVGSGRADTTPTVTLTGPSAPVTEGSAGTFKIKVEGGDATTEYTFDWTLNSGDPPSASANDFPAISGGPVTVTTDGDGNGDASFDVATTDDPVYEGSADENVKLTLSPGDIVATMSIHDNDAKPVITIQDAAAPEGNSATKMTFDVKVNRPSQQPITFTIQTKSQSAFAGEDFVNASGTNFTIPAGALAPSSPVEVTINGDTKVEPNETFEVELTNYLGGAEGGRVVAVGTIQNDDETPPPPPPPPPGKISIVGGGASESTGLVPFVVTVKGAHPEVSFNYHTENGGATAPADYQAVNTAGPRIPAGSGDASVQITIPVVDDQLDEVTETFSVTLTDIVGAEVDGSPTTTLSIENDDNNSSISIGDATVGEGKTADVTLSLSPTSGRAVNVNYTVKAGTAAAGRFTASSGSVTLPPGTTTATIPVVTLADAASHPNETVLVEITPSGAKAGKTTGTVTIIDNEAPPTLAIADASGPEGATLTFTVSLLGAPSGSDVTVAFSTVDGERFPNAVAPGDYTSANGTVTFKPGETTKTISVTTVDDSTAEADEVFFVLLSSPQGAALSASSRAVAKIVDNDGGTAPPPTPTTPGRTTPGPTGPGTTQPRSFAGPVMVITVPATLDVTNAATVVVKVTCPATAQSVCAGTVSLLNAKQSRLALNSFTGLKPNATTSVKLTLSAAGMKELKLTPNKVVKLTLSVDALSGDSNLQKTEKPVGARYVAANAAKTKIGPVMLLVVPATLVVGKDSVLFVPVKCPRTAAGACAGTVSLLNGKTKFAVNSFSKLKPNSTASVRLWVKAAAMKQLKRTPNKVVKLKLSVVATATGTKAQTTTKTIGLTYSPSKKPAKAAPKTPTKSSITVKLP